ncbi:YsnF/AvaK domain-containing protein [Pseudoroseomonas globiformis]|uniref:YsnF/AvaK domain-containing protein n=1 Tax=Teichococcus globiformis TaxID=2307229 RepID=A0ABV7FYD9_9PROT
MTHTITAMFPDRSTADAALIELVSRLSINRDQVSVHAAEAGASGTTETASSDEGFWASLKNLFVSDEDRHTYAEGMRRGGSVVSVQVDDAMHDTAMDILEEQGAVDLDAQEAEWRKSGWSGYQPVMASSMADGTTPGVVAAGYSDEIGIGMAQTDGAYAASGMSATAGAAKTPGTGVAQSSTEEVIPVVEEQLRVGKRDVERGRVRVRSYVVETPVAEQVTLRDEHVDVHRRTVDRPITDAAQMFQERTIEAIETDEEAVVAKEARVTEELVIQKGTSERVETVHDTVRHTEVDIDDTTGATRNAATGTATSTKSNPPGTVASRTTDKALGTDISGTNPNKR